MWFETTKVFLTSGAATGGQSLNAFDNALRSAGIADFNLIRVTSIVPPSIPVYHLPRTRRLVRGEGQLIPTIYEAISSNEIGRRIAVAVGVGMTAPGQKGAGIIFTYSCQGTKDEAERIVRTMVKEGMHAKGYARHRCKVASAAAIVQKTWTVVIAAAVFCDRELEKLFSLKLSPSSGSAKKPK